MTHNSNDCSHVNLGAPALQSRLEYKDLSRNGPIPKTNSIMVLEVKRTHFGHGDSDVHVRRNTPYKHHYQKVETTDHLRSTLQGDVEKHLSFRTHS